MDTERSNLDNPTDVTYVLIEKGDSFFKVRIESGDVTLQKHLEAQGLTFYANFPMLSPGIIYMVHSKISLSDGGGTEDRRSPISVMGDYDRHKEKGRWGKGLHDAAIGYLEKITKDVFMDLSSGMFIRGQVQDETRYAEQSVGT